MIIEFLLDSKLEEEMKKIAMKEGPGSSYHLADSDSEPDFGIDDEGEFDWLDEEDDIDDPRPSPGNDSSGSSKLPQSCYEPPPGDEPTSLAPLPKRGHDSPPENKSSLPIQRKNKKTTKKNVQVAMKKRPESLKRKMLEGLSRIMLKEF